MPLLSCGLLLIASACQAETSTFNPRGDGARHIADLWIIMLILAAVVYLQVIALFSLALFRRRRSNAAENVPPDTGRPFFIIANGVAISLVILAVIFGVNLVTLEALSPSGTDSALTIEVIGHRWWWEVRYPAHGVVTANEIVIPTGAQVELCLTSVDVIHSLWVPVLNGKADLIPGQTNRMTLHTDEPGEYHGFCAELCGVQHVKMRLCVIAQAPGDFEAWIAQQQQSAPAPQDALTLRGQQIFIGMACVFCHTVRGTNVSGVIGPDLTHLARRRTLAAGEVPNTPGYLSGWIVDPQSIKLGKLMPPMYIESADLQALLAYLKTLQ